MLRTEEEEERKREEETEKGESKDIQMWLHRKRDVKQFAFNKGIWRMHIETTQPCSACTQTT